MGGKNARNNVSRNTRIVRAKNVGEKIVGKKCEKLFFTCTQISLQNMGGKKRETIYQKHKNSAIKKFWEKIVGKVRKTFFYIHTNIVTKKWGEQNVRNNFSRNTLIVRAKNVGGKIAGKKCEKRLFIFTRIS